MRAKRIYIGNLDLECTAKELLALFKGYGRAYTAETGTDDSTGQSSRFGYVEMEDDEEALRAIAALDGAEFRGRRLEVREAKPRWERGPKAEWRLLDMTEPIWDPYSEEDDGRYTVIDAEETLVRELRRHAREGPRCLRVEHSSWECIYANVKPVYSAVSWPVPGHPGKELSATPAQQKAIAPESFLNEGLEFEIPPECLIPTEDAVEIVLHFYRTRQLADWVAWK